MQATLSLEHVHKSYDEFIAVKDVSFQIMPGQLFGLLGPNGAGKTSLMRMIVNILIPDRGEIHLFGEPFRESTKNRIGYLPEERGLYTRMKILDHLVFLGEMNGLNGSTAKERAQYWLKNFEIEDRAQKKVLELSKGLQQKVQFIGTILHEPDLLIVDEPFSGLDPVNTRFLIEVLLELKKKGTSIILSTHLMDQAERLCDEIFLINRGERVLSGSIDQIKKEHRLNAVTLKSGISESELNGWQMVESVRQLGDRYEVALSGNDAQQQLFQKLAESGHTVEQFQVSEASLNDIFIYKVGGNNE